MLVEEQSGNHKNHMKISMPYNNSNHLVQPLYLPLTDGLEAGQGPLKARNSCGAGNWHRCMMHMEESLTLFPVIIFTLKIPPHPTLKWLFALVVAVFANSYLREQIDPGDTVRCTFPSSVQMFLYKT